jgi:hypothetical protein
MVSNQRLPVFVFRPLHGFSDSLNPDRVALIVARVAFRPVPEDLDRARRAGDNDRCVAA